MALENPYCTVAEARNELRNQNAAEQSTIEWAINAASRFIDEHKGRDFYFHDHSSTPLKIDRFNGAILGEILYLPYFPVITLTSVVVADEEWTADEDYVVKDGRRLCSLCGDWPAVTPPNYIELTGTFGYAQASASAVPTGLPAHIRAACAMIAAAVSGQLVKDQIGFDGTKTSISDKEIPKRALLLLGPRRLDPI